MNETTGYLLILLFGIVLWIMVDSWGAKTDD